MSRSNSQFKLVRQDGYHEREIASAETLAELDRQIAEMAGRTALPDGGDDDGSA